MYVYITVLYMFIYIQETQRPPTTTEANTQEAQRLPTITEANNQETLRHLTTTEANPEEAQRPPAATEAAEALAATQSRLSCIQGKEGGAQACAAAERMRFTLLFQPRKSTRAPAGRFSACCGNRHASTCASARIWRATTWTTWRMPSITSIAPITSPGVAILAIIILLLLCIMTPLIARRPVCLALLALLV